MKLKWKLSGGLLFSFATAIAQGDPGSFFSYSSVGLQCYAGSSIGNTFKRLRDSDPFSVELAYQRQANVSPFWNHTKRLPQWGIGISATGSGSKQYVGVIVCAYPFVNFPLFTTGAFQGNFRFGFGLAWVEKPYDKIKNPENLLLSQRINTHSNLRLQGEVRLSPHHFINAAASFYHVSNSKTSLPNLGINIPALSVGYRYAFNGETKRTQLRKDSLDKDIFYRAIFSAGVKQMQVPDSSYYFVKLLSVEAAKQISYSSTLSIGAFITHDASVKTDTYVKHLRSISTSQAGLYASYEYHFGRFSIPVQFGVFVYNSNSKLLESIGLRYKISEKWMGQFLLKSHFHRADLMHFGLGYRFR